MNTERNSSVRRPGVPVGSAFVVILAIVLGALLLLPATALGQGTGTATPGTPVATPSPDLELLSRSVGPHSNLARGRYHQIGS